MTKNIGLPVKEPKKKAVENESNNPFNGSLTIRGKLFEGIVINAKAKGPLLFKRSLQFISQNLKDLDEVKIKFMHMFHLT